MSGAERPRRAKGDEARVREVKSRLPWGVLTKQSGYWSYTLVTMHVDTGDSPPICQKPYTLPLKHYSWVQQEVETLERAGIIKKSLSPWASPIVVVPKKSAPGEPPRWRMCIDFRKINDLQPQVRRVDSATSGNISLVPLPKIDEMYAALHGAKIFTTLDLRSGYYHISLDEESKAKLLS